MKKLYSVSCEHVELYMIRVEANNEDEARRSAIKELQDLDAVSVVKGYVGRSFRANTVIEVQEE